MSFKKVNVGNDWMHLYYSFGPVLNKYGTSSISLGTLEFKEGQLVRVRWPNGKEENVTVRMKTNRGQYSDMGHLCDYTNAEPYVVSSLNGKETWTKLTDLELWDAEG